MKPIVNAANSAETHISGQDMISHANVPEWSGSGSGITHTSVSEAGSGAKPIWFYRPELTIGIVGLFALFIDFVLIIVKNSQIAVVEYAALLSLIAGLMILGMYYRRSGRSGRIGAAAICAGLFLFFSLSLSMFNYLLLPLWREPIDLQLHAIDRMFGYHWPSLIEWASNYPLFNKATRIAYMSTIPQIAAIIVILGMTGRIKELHTLIVSVAITATITICFWGIVPSFGTTVIHDLPQIVEQSAAPAVNTFYGEQLIKMALEGPGIISPKEIKGLVAFPSYHIVLAVTAIYASRTVLWLFPIYLVLNALIFPGVFLHGGHHFIDMPAGVVLAVAGIYLARKAVSAHYNKEGLPGTLSI